MLFQMNPFVTFSINTGFLFLKTLFNNSVIRIKSLHCCHITCLWKQFDTCLKSLEDQGVGGMVPSELQYNYKILHRRRSLLSSAPTSSSPWQAMKGRRGMLNDIQVPVDISIPFPNLPPFRLPFPPTTPPPPPAQFSYGEMQLLPAAEGHQADFSLSGMRNALMSSAPSSIYHVCSPACFQRPPTLPF